MAFDPAQIECIGDLVSLQRGNTYKSKLLGFPGPVLLGLASIERGGGFRSDNLKTYGGDSPEKLRLYAGDIYVSLKDVTQAADLLGAVVRVPNGVQGRLTQDTVKLVMPNIPDDWKAYLYWLLRTPEYRAYCKANSMGTTNLSLSREDFLSYPVPQLSGERQHVITALESIESRINHNRALAANLEAIARRLFKSWFVDFDPVRAKAVGEKPAGLADDLAVLFPDRFVDSELGDAPDGWKVGKISDFSTNIRVGCTPSQFSSEDFYVGLEHFDRRCLTLWNGGRGDDATSNKSRFSKGDLLFGKLRPYFHKVAIAQADGICSTDILVIRCTDSAYREFMYLSLFQDEVIQFVSDASGGTRMPRTNWETLAGYDCVVPPQPVACAFGEIVAPMIETMMQCVSENDALTKIRDLLLPRLISGKLHVADAESFIEEVIE